MRVFVFVLSLLALCGVFGWAAGFQKSDQAKTPMRLLITDWTKSYQLYKQPHAIWLDQDDFVGANRKIIAMALEYAEKKQQNPEFVVYSIPIRDLGQSSDGGFENLDLYWKDNQVNAGLLKEFFKRTGLAARVYLEPDALSLSVQYQIDNAYNEESKKIYQDRIKILPRLIKLYQDAGAVVYLEGAHSDWFDYADENIGWMAKALNDAGIKHADGLVTNVSNRQTLTSGERNEFHYLGRLLPRLDNKKLDVVVDTSRNGGVTKPRQYYMAPNGMLIDNEIPTGRLVGSWKKDADGQVRLFSLFGKPKTLSRLLGKEKYKYNLKKSILTAPGWLDPVGDVKLGPPPTDQPPPEVADRIHRLRYVKPPDDCDGSLNCPPGFSKSQIIQETKAKQPTELALPPSVWL